MSQKEIIISAKYLKKSDKNFSCGFGAFLN